MLRAAICEDHAVFAKMLADKAAAFFQKQGIQLEVQLFCTEQEIQGLNITAFELFLLDIELGSVKGLDIGNRIHRENPSAGIIYISSYYSHVFSGYKACPIVYILKADPQFENTLDDAFEDFIDERSNRASDTILLKYKEAERAVAVDQILYIESMARKLAFYMTKNEHMEIYGRISDMEQQLSGQGFLRVHRSYLVNMRYIQKISNYRVFVSNRELPASESKYTEITALFALWKGLN